ncbi:DUF1273 domain-containing protein [Limosilactobacillus mucosae]|uniref:DUF1273 domain-containing protein n=1 Tax=Limosilactobacillus mucosae TaxID=97478 RepID=UPI00233F49E6|nr:DUF1273 domain-containing protein [Limosilactobacillus mucosae]MDC2841052.1 DUF1273 domain-containing protein [Limosilactobacillus mucosae]MDC2844118.1 DUF1273 domain-containing protein [Limosilactobacillus mucosae]
MKRLWTTGYRAYELGVFDEQKDPKVAVIKAVLQKELRRQLENTTEEFWLITGPQMGVERWSIESALMLQSDFPQLKIALMEPYADFSTRWNENNQARLAAVKSQVDFVGKVSKKKYESPEQLRAYQNFMLYYTDSALLIYDPEREGKTVWDWRAINRYREQNKDYALRMIDFDELQEAAEEYSERLRENSEA